GLKMILQQLQAGQAVVMFPEGTRTHDGRMRPLRPGVHLLIKRARAPIVPVGIAGTFQAWPRTQPYPSLAPLFLPAGSGAPAGSVGRPLDARYYAGLPRERCLAEVFQGLHEQYQRAEQFRRKA